MTVTNGKTEDKIVTVVREYAGTHRQARVAAEAWAQARGTVVHIDCAPQNLQLRSPWLCTIEYAPWC
jgi:hypothetical protein